MNKLRIFISLIIATIFLFFFTAPSLAITKTSGNLEVTYDEEPLFPSDTIWYPGLSETKSITVKNNGSGTEKVAIEASNESETEGLASVLEFKVLEGGTERYDSSKTLKNFFDEGIIQLSDLGGGSTTTYDLTITFKSTAGNEYQGKEAKFDLKIGFWQEAVAPEEEGVISPAVTIAGAAAAPVCTASVPSSAPVLSLTGIGAGTASLSWTPVSPVTHYLIAYGLTSGSYIYGNPNVGNVTGFTVSGLSGGTTYYFAVKGINDCAPGPYSNEVSATPTGPVVVGPPPGFVPILGVATPSGELGEALATEEGEIAGVEVEKICWWWLILSLAEFGILSVYYWWLSRQKKPTRYWWIVALVLALLAYIGDQFVAHQYFIPSRFCDFMWLWSILAATIPTSIYLYFRRK